MIELQEFKMTRPSSSLTTGGPLSGLQTKFIVRHMA
jgi:hypothetical protein